MNKISFEIHYKAYNRTTQRSSFLLIGRKTEQVAFEWWKQIRKEMSFHTELDKVIVNGDQDVTDIVKELES
ncbi:hypothetical protein [Neobacillus massiliamazoniensis]|uniref:Uncharacterized protein n=1 Tax=Neobacillus massiliamazoniensis TaxID=1499688 RepID=A0A0U1NY90_9BACI|nr:hypothetical protein [Neobacillus massiliamazoniensis]CRK83005.1 hypothetical protein BN000_02960 [Neobacillus massiliamazoniensis]